MVCITNYITFAINIKIFKMTTNQPFTSPEDSLKFIEQAILETKTNWQSHSPFYLIWGWGISASCLTQYILIKIGYAPYSFYHWPFVILFCIIASIYMEKKASAAPTTYQYDFINKLWMVLGISFGLMGFVVGKQGISPSIISLLIAGIGTLTSGLIMKYKPLIFGGIVLFIGCLSSTFVNAVDSLLINAIALIFGYIIPAYLLKNAEL